MNWWVPFFKNWITIRTIISQKTTSFLFPKRIIICFIFLQNNVQLRTKTLKKPHFSFLRETTYSPFFFAEDDRENEIESELFDKITRAALRGPYHISEMRSPWPLWPHAGFGIIPLDLRLSCCIKHVATVLYIIQTGY